MKTLLFAVMLFGLTACGFQLRGTQGSPPMAFSSIYITGGGKMGEILKTWLSGDERIRVLPVATVSDVVLTIEKLQQEKNILTINRIGRVNEYELILTAIFSVRSREGRLLIDQEKITTRRDMGYSDSALLGKEQEEAVLYQDMHRDLALQILYRLAALKRSSPAVPVISSP